MYAPRNAVGSKLTSTAGLIHVATVEHGIAKHATSVNKRPGTASNAQTPLDSQVAALEAELRGSGHPSEDVVQGKASILWARWVGQQLSDQSVASTTFEPGRAAADANSLWTKICVVKAVYIRGMLLSQAGNDEKGREFHQTLVPWLDSNRSLVISTPQLLYWAQQLLGQLALVPNPSDETAIASVNVDDIASSRVQAFRHWAVLCAKSPDVLPSTYINGPGHVPKLTLWKAYYRFISDILQQNLGTNQQLSITRSELAAELRRVETSYENELLRNTHFPKAAESNSVIEEWVEEFIHNWRIMCGPDWSDTDLGEGGRSSLGRNVLDMLYRAAAKTFHSTLILRRLFQVHKALTDFDLAYKALDTYIELVDRARARADKSDLQTTGSDSDGIFLETMAEGIEALCAFGRQLEAEKAYDLCVKLEDTLQDLDALPPNPTTNGAGIVNGESTGYQATRQPLPEDLVEVVCRAIGIGKAHWAHWTPFSEMRSTLQSEAIEYLQKAAAQKVPLHRQLKTLYALSRLLAETRDIDQAIAVAKKGLECDVSLQETDHAYRTQRQLIPFWHLLALLLTSRQDFELAGQSCVAAFEQFSPPDIIFGSTAGGHEVGEKQISESRKPGLVDDMECDELQKIIEIRASELALTELTEGHEQAVNSSNDLLALYSRLFGRYGTLVTSEDKSKSRLAQPPKTATGTVKSFRGSIFSRRRIGRWNDSEKVLNANEPPSIAEETTRPNTQTTQAPTIHVTDEDEKSSPQKHRRFRLSLEHSRDEKIPPTGDLPVQGGRRRLSRSRSRGRKDTSHRSSTEQSYETTQETAPHSDIHAAAAQPELETIISRDGPDVPVSANHGQSPPGQHQIELHQQAVRLPYEGSSLARIGPVPRFPKAASQRHALSILVKIWLVIATLYRRATMFDDSREACDEAAKVVAKIDAMIAAVESSARAFGDGGWGTGGKSSDELWADVHCERADLLMAIARAREEKEGDVYAEGVREAVDQYETCLMYFGDHARGIVGLSNLLLDYSERKVELARKVDGGTFKADEAPEQHSRRHRRDSSRVSEGGSVMGNFDMDGVAAHAPNSWGTALSSGGKDDDLKKTPENLNRLAARDRAYGLLSTLTKLGSGWDNSEAWFALARAHELGGELDKAKEILWWCVELEDRRPIRHWSNVACGGYVL